MMFGRSRTPHMLAIIVNIKNNIMQTFSKTIRNGNVQNKMGSNT